MAVSHPSTLGDPYHKLGMPKHVGLSEAMLPR
jgi:hypothetical protein